MFILKSLIEIFLVQCGIFLPVALDPINLVRKLYVHTNNASAIYQNLCFGIIGTVFTV